MTFVRESYTMVKEQYILMGINEVVDELQDYSYYNEL